MNERNLKLECVIENRDNSGTRTYDEDTEQCVVPHFTAYVATDTRADSCPPMKACCEFESSRRDDRKRCIQRYGYGECTSLSCALHASHIRTYTYIRVGCVQQLYYILIIYNGHK